MGRRGSGRRLNRAKHDVTRTVHVECEPLEARRLFAAFPGASGPAMNATGGRGGDVYHVTNLSDDATNPQPGSLRYGINNAPGGGRTIVFDVGGTIHLSPPGRQGWLTIGKSNLTLAGQTAPGDGVTIMGQATKVTGNNIVIRHMKFRPGQDQAHPGSATNDALWLTGDQIMIDHVSTSWYDDEGISSSDGAGQISVQYNIVSEGLNYADHSYGAIVGSDVPGSNIAYTHNLFAHNRSRLPRLGNETGAVTYAEWSNNVIFEGAGYSGAGQVANGNFVGNTYLRHNTNDPGVFSADVNTHVYQAGNKVDYDGDSNLTNGQEAGWNEFTGSRTKEYARFNIPNISYEAPSVALNNVLDYSGAFWWARDAIDTRIVSETRTTSGTLINLPNATEWNNAWNAPTITRAAGWDTDGDGMPNDWETANGLNPSVDDHNGDAGNGYRNIDLYLQFAAHDGQGPQSQPDAWAPTSAVAPLLDALETTSVPLNWGGVDFGSPASGLANYDVYVSDNGGAYALWQNATTATSGVYTGQFGHTYSFYSRARDAVGNLEAASATPDATTRLTSTTQASPTHWWKFDQTSGDAPDSVSPGGLTMKLTNGPTYAAGFLNNAVVLDGVNDYAKVAASALNSSQPFTVAGWVYWDGNSATNSAISLDDNPFVLQKRGDNGRFSFGMTTTAPGGAEVSAQWATAPTPNTWYHLAGVFTGLTIGLYVNGQLVANTPFSDAFAAISSASFSIGSDKPGGGVRGNYWHGRIDDVRTYNTALNGDQVADLVYSTDTIAPASSVAPLPANTSGNSFTVSWSGTDTGASGLKNYDVYLSVDGGAYTLWQSATTATSALFNVVEGSQFRFYSRARDNAGNLEAAPASPDAQTTVGAILPAWLAPGSAATWDAGTKVLNVTGAATIVADPGADAPAIAASGASAVLMIDPSGGSLVNVATLSLADGAVVTVANHGANLVRALVLNANPTIAAGAKLDLTNNVLVVRNGNATGIRSQLAATYAGGNWTGTGGLTSSAAADDPAHGTALGFCDNAALNKTSFAGVSGLTSSAVLVKFTYAGDANLDGQVDIGDLGLLAGAWQQPSGKTWFDGDFTYDGAVAIGDLGLLAGNWQKGIGNPL